MAAPAPSGPRRRASRGEAAGAPPQLSDHRAFSIGLGCFGIEFRPSRASCNNDSGSFYLSSQALGRSSDRGAYPCGRARPRRWR
eukprot:6199002-Pleurochrysis_carterae.AAC.2